jgi:hypothetical protein
LEKFSPTIMGVARTTKFIDAMFPIDTSYGDRRVVRPRGETPECGAG